uniref:Ig-like domain-containing protein n=1 Tax=Myripristis murdjan TaxID=586833 RepID=A0A667WKF8_9TELE
MIKLWVTVFLLHRVCKYNPILSKYFIEQANHIVRNSRKVQWYKQSIGETLELITTSIVGPKLKVESISRYELKTFINMSHLTISSTIQEDEAMYHCAVTYWKGDDWSGTFLSLKGNHVMSDYTVVQRPVSEPVYEGDPVTLQCSLLSDSENKACPAGHSVFWFRAGSDESHPRIIYTHGNRSDGCEKSPEAGSPPQSCVYNFSKSSVNSSDAGTYYCAVATCGEILFGNATKLDIEEKGSPVFIALITTAVCLALSVIGNIENQMSYAALSFSERKATRGRKKRESFEESVYSDVKSE